MCPGSGPHWGVTPASCLPLRHPHHHWSLLGNVPVGWRRCRGGKCLLPPVWLGVWQSCVFVLLFSKQLARDSRWRRLFEDPHSERLELNLFRHVRAPQGPLRGPTLEAVLAGVRQPPSEGAPDSETLPGLDARPRILAWVWPYRTERRGQGSASLNPLASLAGQVRARDLVPLPSAHPGACLLPDYLSRNFYCSPRRHCSLAGM